MIRAKKKRAAHFNLFPLLSAAGRPVQLLRLTGLFAVDLDLDVVIQVAGIVATAVKTDVAPLHALGINQPALGRFHVVIVLADTQLSRVVVVVVVDRGRLAEFRVIGNLHHDVKVNPRLLV